MVVSLIVQTNVHINPSTSMVEFDLNSQLTVTLAGGTLAQIGRYRHTVTNQRTTLPGLVDNFVLASGLG